MHDFFTHIAAHLDGLMLPHEHYTAWYSAESSDFVRFNRSAIRQPGHVQQRTLSLGLIAGATHTGCNLSLSGVRETDTAALTDMVAELRSQLAELPEDPHLVLAGEVNNTTHMQASQLPSCDAMVEQILTAAQGYDMVGILTVGSMVRGFANSKGQRNWYQTSTFNFDWSLFHSTDKAVKSNYAGFSWEAARFKEKFSDAAQRLRLLATPPITVQPGDYRVYLAPAALNALVGMLNWAGFAEKALRTRHSALRRLYAEEVQLHPALELSEDSRTGLAPVFQTQGFIKPDVVPLLQQGKMVGSMVSPRSAKEYGVAGNGADEDESATSMVLQAGTLATQDVLRELGTGIYVSNLWYLNFSDRANCRITGMTRFATFWVEDGVIKAPLNVMRFDDSLFRILGDQLLALTRETEVIMDDRSYGARSTGGAIVPGAMIAGMKFVL